MTCLSYIRQFSNHRIPFLHKCALLDPDLQSKHMGETETRIKRIPCFNTIPVLGLKEAG
jgi:hypothetical protein